MTWSDLSSDFVTDNPVKASNHLKMYNNFASFAAKESGAPVLANSYVVEAMINASAVSQGKLKTTSGSVSTTSATFVSQTLPGGTYGFFPQTYNSSTGTGSDIVIVDSTVSINSTPTTRICMKTAGGTLQADQRYVQSSPPYNLGNGDIPLFVFGLFQGNNLISTYIAEDPPWANNGPTNVTPDEIFDATQRGSGKVIRKKFRTVRKRAATVEDVLAGRKTVAELSQFVEEKIEITHDVKNADMPLIPHPWIAGNDLSDKTVVLLDPCSDLMRDLACLHSDGENLASLLHGGKFSIDNEAIGGMASPPGVLAVGVRWK